MKWTLPVNDILTGGSVPSQDARSNRLVTFVANQELEYLMQITIDEERSMASVIHRIISAHLKEH